MMCNKFVVSLLMVLILMTTACSNESDNKLPVKLDGGETTSMTPDESSFTATIQTPNISEVNKDLVMEASLKNVSKEDYDVSHAAGVFYFSVKDSNGKAVNQFVMNQPKIQVKLKSEGDITERYSYQIDTPGVYEISAVAKFSVGEGDEEKKYVIHTNSMKVLVELKKQSLQVEDIASLQVVGGLLGMKGSPLFQNTEQTGKTIITKVVGWINSSKPVGIQKEYGKHGYPMVIEIKMNDGKIISVEPGYKCDSKTNADGSGSKSCSSVKAEIVINNDSTKMRAESPELYEWLNEGWTKEVLQTQRIEDNETKMTKELKLK